MRVILIWAALMALLSTVTSPIWASDHVPPSAKPAVEILSLDLHPSDRGTPRPWKQIGVDMFTGDVKKGGEVLMKDTTIRISEVQEAWQMRLRDECHPYYLKNGDKVRTTFGANKSLPAEVAFASPAGDPERRGDVCLVRSDGTAVVFLDGCGNISVAQAKVKKVEPPTPVAGVCGSNATQYAHTVTEWPTGGDLCEGKETSSRVNFPDQAKISWWICPGDNGGKEVVCVASRDAAPLPSVPKSTQKKPVATRGYIPQTSRSFYVGPILVPICNGNILVPGGSGQTSQGGIHRSTSRLIDLKN